MSDTMILRKLKIIDGEFQFMMTSSPDGVQQTRFSRIAKFKTEDGKEFELRDNEENIFSIVNEGLSN